MSESVQADLVDVRITAPGDAAALILDNRIAALLQAVREKGSLYQGARLTGVAYNTAWLLLKRSSEAVGQPLLKCQRGHGSELTPKGDELLDGYLALHSTAAQAAQVLLEP